MSSRPPIFHPRAGFTLIEILIATTAFAIVLAAINGVYYSAIRLRNKTTLALDDAAPIEHGLATIKRDLLNIVAPGGTLSGTLQSTSSSNKLAGQASPNFYTSTGTIDETTPWSDMQRVSYLLVAPTNTGFGNDLVRSVSRNLLPSLQDEYTRQRLMSGVQTLTFLYYDGNQWRDSWDSTTPNLSTGLSNTLPNAIKVQLQLASPAGRGSGRASSAEPVASRRDSAIELVVPIRVQAPTNQTQQAQP